MHYDQDFHDATVLTVDTDKPLRCERLRDVTSRSVKPESKAAPEVTPMDFALNIWADRGFGPGILAVYNFLSRRYETALKENPT